MEKTNDIKTIKSRRSLRDFIRLVLAYYACQMLLAIYQNIVLFTDGVLDSVINKSLLLQWVNHAGFTAIVGLFLAFVYKFLEGRKYGCGFSITYGVFTLLLISEGLLIRFFTRNYEVLDTGFAGAGDWSRYGLAALVLAGLSILFLRVFYKIMAGVYGRISKMYPFTIVLFSLFLASLMADKKPVNKNKTQHLLVSAMTGLWEVNPYMGKAEYPLLRTYLPDQGLVPYFNLSSEKPNIVLVLLDGLGHDFVGPDARYRGFTPFLDSLLNESLYWKNFLSNTGLSQAAMASITGSLPFGQQGFTHLNQYVNRQTLFSLLKNNGYATAFHYGGNTAIEQWDRFLAEEQLDYVYDDKGFANGYQKQQADAAGISLGYPDKALFHRWSSENRWYQKPRFECFVTLSSRSPFLIPEAERYTRQVMEMTEEGEWDRRQLRLIKKNREKFASILYADDALKSFMDSYRLRPDYQNTIFIVTGTHNMAELPQDSPLERYRVPFMIYSPLLLSPGIIGSLASHSDLMPSLVGLLDHSYDMDVPAAVAWLGEGLTGKTADTRKRTIPLLRHGNNIQDFIWGNYLLSAGEVFKLDAHLGLHEEGQTSLVEEINERFRFFKSANTYVLRENKLVPETLALNTKTGSLPDKQELVWIQSVFNGSNYDNAYDTARKLALEGNTERALLLCRHILDKVPGHADTEILMGRIYGWQEEYGKAADILKSVIRKYPVYTDGYLALLDIYYWSGDYEKALGLRSLIRKNNLKNLEIEEKMERAEDQKKRSIQEQITSAGQAQAAVSVNQSP